VPIPFLRPAEVGANGTLTPVAGGVTLHLPDLLVVVSANIGAPSTVRLAPRHDAPAEHVVTSSRSSTRSVGAGPDSPPDPGPLAIVGTPTSTRSEVVIPQMPQEGQSGVIVSRSDGAEAISSETLFIALL
jgi:hypothetical protein